MKQVVIVSPYFAPSNLTSGHRARHFAAHLAKFGWKAKILCVNPRYYEESPDYELEKLIPPGLEVIRSRALPTRPIRMIGDISIRAFLWNYQILCNLARRKMIDLLYILIPPNYTAVLGNLLFRTYAINYAIDYIDPWVHAWPGCEKPFSKAWLAYQLNRKLEPVCLRHVSLITGVSAAYYEPVFKRYDWLKSCPSLAVPYGADEDDFRYLDQHPRETFLFNRHDGNFHIIYAGAMLPRAYSTLRALLQALVCLRKNNPAFARKLKLHFVGTGSDPFDKESFTVRPLARDYGVLDIVEEYPARLPYLEVLNHLKYAGAVLILGSSEAHYTPSKIFQAILSQRPVIALLHAESAAVDMLQRIGLDTFVTFSPDKPADTCASQIAGMFAKVMDESYRQHLNWAIFNEYSSENMARKLAGAFDKINPPIKR